MYYPAILQPVQFLALECTYPDTVNKNSILNATDLQNVFQEIRPDRCSEIRGSIVIVKRLALRNMSSCVGILRFPRQIICTHNFFVILCRLNKI
jgi:hypothetical protein